MALEGYALRTAVREANRTRGTRGLAAVRPPRPRPRTAGPPARGQRRPGRPGLRPARRRADRADRQRRSSTASPRCASASCSPRSRSCSPARPPACSSARPPYPSRSTRSTPHCWQPPASTGSSTCAPCTSDRTNCSSPPRSAYRPGRRSRHRHHHRRRRGPHPRRTAHRPDHLPRARHLPATLPFAREPTSTHRAGEPAGRGSGLRPTAGALPALPAAATEHHRVAAPPQVRMLTRPRALHDPGCSWISRHRSAREVQNGLERRARLVPLEWRPVLGCGCQKRRTRHATC